MDSLTTTNTLLTILTVLGLAEAVVFLGAVVALLLLIRRLTQLVEQMETRYVAPAAERVHAILGDVHDVTSAVKTDVQTVRSLLQWLLRWVPTRDTSTGGPAGTPPN